ncbi:MAG TPA: hypothetical protein VIM51_13775 [Desulfosporosinus sp.]
MVRSSSLELKIMAKIKELEEAITWASHGYTSEEVLAILKELLE